MSKKMSVQVRRSQLRSTPSFTGRIVATVAYGDTVTGGEEKNGWVQVVLPDSNTIGWMHASALTTRKIALKAGEKDVQGSASGDEIALAGKGFNQEVEGEFKRNNPRLDFTWIDRMEDITVTPGQMQQFLQTGRVFPKGGDQ